MAPGGWDWAAARAICLRHARAILGPGPAAEDAAQEALVRAWRMRANCRTPDSPEPWLATIARREALRVVARARERALEDVDTVATAASPEVGSVRRIDVRRAISSLSAQDRALVGARYFEDLTQTEVAERLGMA